MMSLLEFIKEPYNIISILLIIILLTIAFWRLNSLLKKEEVPKKYLGTIVFLFILLFLTPFLVLIENDNVSIYSSWLSSLFLAFFILSLQEASTYRSNERINETYKEIKEIKNITNEIKESILEIKKLRGEIESLKTILNKGDFSSKISLSLSQNKNPKNKAQRSKIFSFMYNYFLKK